MSEQRTYQGHVYTREAPGQPWTLAGPAAPALPSGGTIIRDPRAQYAAPTAEAELARTNQSVQKGAAELPYAAPAAQASVTNAQLEAEKRRHELATADRAPPPSGFRYLPNGNLEKIPGGPLDKDTAAATAQQQRLAAFDSLVQQVNSTQKLFNAGPGATKGVAGVYDYLPSEANSKFNAAAAGLADQYTSAFRVRGVGSQSDADAARAAAASQPSASDFDGSALQKLQQVRERIDVYRKANGLPPAQWEGLNPQAERDLPFDPNGASVDPKTGLMVVDVQGQSPAPQTPQAASIAPQGGYSDSLLAQGMSGVNQGIANTLGAPVDLANLAFKAGASGINALTNSNIQTSDRPFLGSGMIGDWMRQAGSINAPSKDPTNRFVRRVGESVGGAVVPVGATAGSASAIARALIPSLTGGIGAAAAQQLAPNNPYAEVAAELLGGGVGSFGVAKQAQRAAQRGIESAIPDTQQLRQQAGDLYKQAEQNGIKATPAQTQDFADQLRDFAGNEGLLDAQGNVLAAAYPKAGQALKMVDSYAGGDMTVPQMQTVRKVLGDARQSTDAGEGRIAGMMLRQFDDFTAPLAPELSQARATAARYLQTEELEKARQLAESRAGQFSQSGMENSLRTQYRGLERGVINGTEHFNPAVVAQISDVAQGTPTRNAVRLLGKFAPKGPVSALGGAGLGTMVGTAVGSPVVGGVAGALLSGGGMAAANAAEKMTSRSAQIAELMARNGGAIDQVPIMSDEIRRIIAANLAGGATNRSANGEVQ